MYFVKWLPYFLAKLPMGVEKNVEYSKPRFLAFSAIAAIGFPLYYLIWNNLFPQLYENLWLRLLGSALFTPLVFAKYWAPWARRRLSFYWYFTILYALPFFFTFMLLKNQQSIVWLMSTLIATFVMVLLLDGFNLCLQLLLGVGLACLAYILTDDGASFSLFPWEYLPIYMFAVFIGVAANFNREKIELEKRGAMLVATSNIAHELRTPLLGIQSGADGLRHYLPALLDAYQQAKTHQLPITPIRTIHLATMEHVLERISNEVYYSNKIIDMLLMNARTQGFDTENFARLSMRDCITQALLRYPFASEQEKQGVKLDEDADFYFYGSDLLMIHVLFNLLKNALFQIAKANKGQISISLEVRDALNVLRFKDSAGGIPAEILPHLFTPFFSWSSDSQRNKGAGLGLAFCKSVIESFGGTITCRSQLGVNTEFIMSFPKDVAQ